MRNLILILVSIVTLNLNAQIYSNEKGIVTSKSAYLEDLSKYIPMHKHNIIGSIPLPDISGNKYDVRVGRFDGWENEPGDFDVIEFYQNGQLKLTLKECEGIIRFSNTENYHSKEFRHLSKDDYTIIVPVSSTSYAAMFFGQSYGCNFPRLFIFILTEHDIKPVYNLETDINDIKLDANIFNMRVNLDFFEGGEREYDYKNIFVRNEVLHMK